ncbi:MAG: ATP-binding protein, partial [Candidatus Aenigmarchaeota archaeon]|nr:ATP-binding protein [Candidatus Aenigmarchaeota archaeon]
MEIAQRMEEFIREKYYTELLKAAKEDGALVIDFSDMDRFDPITADQVLEAPKTVLEAMQKSVEIFGLGGRVNVRLRNIPESRNIRIRSLRARHLNRLWCIDAIIKSASEVKPQIYEATFVCPECGTRIDVPQEGNLLQKAFACQCGRRGDFGEPVEKKMYDVRWLTGVEPFEITTGEQPGEIRIILKEDLTTPKMQKKTDPGARLRIVGMLIEAPKHIKGRLSTKMDMFFEALHVETKDVEFEDMDITPDDERRIKEMASDPKIYERLKMSIAPGIYGFDEIKESIALQLFGGIKHTLPDGNTIRGNIHILLTGDPGIGKSMFLKLVSNLVPRGKYVSGSGVTGAGLTATVRKDEILGGWVLEAGALILANKGVISIDEFDKIGKDDQIAMHEGMSIETVSIAKASIVATLPAETAVLAGANPKFGRFDPYMPIADQITIPETLLSIAPEEPVIYRENGTVRIEPVSDLVDRYCKGVDSLPIGIEGIEVPAFNKDFKMEWWPVRYVFRHKAKIPLYRIALNTGRGIIVTKGHSLFVFEDAEIKTTPSDKIKSGDWVVIPKKLPKNSSFSKEIDIIEELSKMPADTTKNVFI